MTSNSRSAELFSQDPLFLLPVRLFAMRSFAMKTLQIFAIGVVFSLTQLNAAPQSGRRQQERGQDRVCFYKDIHYQGAEQCYRPGDEVTTLQNQRNTISSIRTYGRALVTVYDETNFNGDSMQFDSNAPDLGQVRLGGSRSWNDKIQ